MYYQQIHIYLYMKDIPQVVCLLRARNHNLNISSLPLEPPPLFDGVVESPIYCVAAVFQKLGILHVLPRP